MTCIVGCTHKGKTYLGGDSFSGNPTFHLPIKSPKVFKNGCLMFGISGSWRLNQVIAHELKFPVQKPKNVEKFLTSTVMPQLQKVAESVRNVEDPVMIDFLIGCNGRLFHIQNDFAFTESVAGYNSAGMGWEYALAVLEAYEGLKPLERLKKALEMAEKFSPLVKSPFTFLEG